VRRLYKSFGVKGLTVTQAATQTLTPWKQLMISRCLVSPRKRADKSQHPCLKLIKAMQGNVQTLVQNWNWPALCPVQFACGYHFTWSGLVWLSGCAGAISVPLAVSLRGTGEQDTALLLTLK
jgi:hypothetical protein